MMKRQATPERCDPTKFGQYHITYTPPFRNEYVDWPNGCWGIYAIDCDEIARRVRFDSNGKVAERTSWPGYLGTTGSLEGVTKLIADHQAKLNA
jgi:hypothetical protein